MININSAHLFICLSVILLYLNCLDSAKTTDLIERVVDIKDFKKLLRTKNNVLVLFTTKQEKSAEMKKLLPVLTEVSNTMYGKATIAIVDCVSEEGKKLCKKWKVQPIPIIVKHYSNGDFNKDYDRQDTATSMVNFLKDPKGDIPWSEDPQSTDIIHIEHADVFRKLLRKQPRSLLTMFYAPWCGHCKRMKPDYAEAASVLKSLATLVAIDTTIAQNSQLSEQYNVSGFPTLIYFEDGKVKYPFEGERTKDGIIQWMKDPQPPKATEPDKEWVDEVSEVNHLTDDNFDAFIAAHKSVLVMFYAPWCGHCKSMKPGYTEAAAELKAGGFDAKLAAVDATKHKKLNEKFELKGFPTVKYFQNGEFAWDYGEREKDKIMAFMKNPQEPPPPPVPEQAWADVESDVIHLTTADFKSELKTRKFALVMFYAPWCGHCKAAKPHFQGAATTFRENARVMFAAVDCTQEVELCQEFDVNGYPTIKYFSYLKHSESYSGGRQEADFASYMAVKAGAPLPESTKEPIEQPAAPEPVAEDPWEPEVTQLDASGFLETLKKSTDALVMFYAPWCGHCKKAKPEFNAAAQTLKDDKSKLFATLDCTKFGEFCREQDVKGYPTFKLYKSGTFYSNFAGGRTTTDFINGLNDLASKKTEL